MFLRKPISVSLLVFAMTGCASTGSEGYPSLEIRDVERAQGSFEPIEAERLAIPKVEVDLAGGLEARLAALVDQAATAHAAFRDALPAVERRVAAGAGGEIGSDVWASAQVGLADLDSSRSQAAIALADLDILHTAATLQADETAAITEARETVVALVAEEDAALERLRAQMR